MKPMGRAGAELTEGCLLALESTCDETAAAVIRADRTVLSSVVATQTELHQDFGGVVPELASRAHVQRLLPVVDQAIRDAGIALSDLTAVAVASEPGLVGSLLVGVTAAKTLAWTLDLPLVTINHIAAHLYACRMVAGESVFPAVGVVLSGGHSHLYNCRSAIDFELIGWTIDDAAGEAFDKVARVLDLPYPGGPSIDNLARQGDRTAFAFPRPMLHDRALKFSFSGLKTAVLYEARGNPGRGGTAPPLTPQRTADIAASFQEAVVDVVISKCRRALRQTGYHTLCVGGGVACNSRLRERLSELDAECRVVCAPPELCTDNAAMGAIAWELLALGRTAPLDVDVSPGLVRVR